MMLRTASAIAVSLATILASTTAHPQIHSRSDRLLYFKIYLGEYQLQKRT
jgi:hypothetical protein